MDKLHDEAPAPGGHDDELITVKEACQILGGINPMTYRRGQGVRYPRPVEVSPMVRRVSRNAVLEARRRIIEQGR